jgi:hypothetical protein
MHGLGGPTAGNNGFEEYGGLDLSSDPELALALRVSAEEARAKEEAKVSFIFFIGLHISINNYI